MNRLSRNCAFIVSLALFFAICPRAIPANAAVAQRIISLTPGITEMLFALGLGPRVVGDTNYCDYPPQAKNIPHIGDAVVNYEAVVALKPDMVVADALANEQAIARLKALHLNVLEIHARNFQELNNSLLDIGSATATSTAAEKIVKHEQQRETEVADGNSVHPKHPKTLVIVGTDPLYVAGPNTFVGDMISLAGGVNAVGTPGFIPYSKETAISDNPQVIICSKDDLESIKNDPAWSATTAVQLGNIVTIDPDLIFRPGPRLIDGLEQIASIIQHARTR